MPEVDIAEAKLREYAQNMRDGKVPKPDALEWMRAEADRRGLDFGTLVGGSNAHSIWGGAKAGASFGFNDELAGAMAAIVPGGEDYEGARDQSRAMHRTQEFMDPYAYGGTKIAAEIGATMIPYVGAAGKVAKVGTAAKVAGAAALGAGESALAQYGAQEGSNNPFNPDMAIAAGLGGAGGVLGGAVLGALGRRGIKVQQAAQKELDRIMKEADISMDEAIEGIADGSLATKNKTLQVEAKAAYDHASIGARQTARETTEAAATQGRQEVVDATRARVAPELQQATTEPAFKRATDVPDVDARYADAAQRGNVRIAAEGVPPDMMETIERMAAMQPGVVQLINQNAQGAFFQAGGRQADWTPVVRMTDEGLEWLRTPSVDELGQINRSVRDAVTGMYKNPTAVPSTQRAAMDEGQKGFRERLGQEYPEWGQITSEVATSKDMQDAFKLAQGVGQSPRKAGEFLDTFMTYGPEQKQAAQAAILGEIQQRMGRAGPTAMPTRALGGGDSLDLEPHMAAVIREVFPGEELPDVIRRAGQKQEVFNALTTGSPTAERLARSAPYQQQPSAAGDIAQSIGIDMAAGTGGAVTGARVAGPIISKIRSVLGADPQKVADTVLKALITDNPQVFMRAAQGDQQAIAFAKRLIAGAGVGGGAVGLTDAGQGGLELLGFE